MAFMSRSVAALGVLLLLTLLIPPNAAAQTDLDRIRLRANVEGIACGWSMDFVPQALALDEAAIAVATEMLASADYRRCRRRALVVVGVLGSDAEARFLVDWMRRAVRRAWGRSVQFVEPFKVLKALGLQAGLNANGTVARAFLMRCGSRAFWQAAPMFERPPPDVIADKLAGYCLMKLAYSRDAAVGERLREVMTQPSASKSVRSYAATAHERWTRYRRWPSLRQFFEARRGGQGCGSSPLRSARCPRPDP